MPDPSEIQHGRKSEDELLNALAAEPLNTGQRARIQSLISGTQFDGTETVASMGHYDMVIRLDAGDAVTSAVGAIRAGFIAGEPAQPEGRNGETKPSSLSPFRVGIGQRAGPGEEPAGAGRQAQGKGEDTRRGVLPRSSRYGGFLVVLICHAPERRSRLPAALPTGSVPSLALLSILAQRGPQRGCSFGSNRRRQRR